MLSPKKSIQEFAEKLIEETAKYLFFKDMVDGIIDEGYYSIWEVEGEFNNEDKIRERYIKMAEDYLKEEEFF